ncbi:hypothetical protein ACFYWN_12085 [Streptomyces sp. NPDC002917]|uniref:hypothetical protein n=1 Tax=Streptomyces sp. NPDC002917 TaxID=3364671 RepID=UPI0036AA3804
MSTSDEQPTTAHYRRTPENELPAAPAAQVAAIGRLQSGLLAAVGQFERERRAEIIAAGGDPDEDRDPFEHVRAIADEWADTADDAERRAALLDRLADRLDTSEVRALRLAAEAAVAITPRLIYADADAGVSVGDTAADLGLTPSYVYRVRREQRATN